MSTTKPGALGWIILAAYVWAWDTYAPETLSSAFWRGLAGKKSRVLVLFGWAWVTSHLFLHRPARILIRW